MCMITSLPLTQTRYSPLGILYKGETKISNYNTVLTAEVDRTSRMNQGKSEAELLLDLSREFKWSDTARTFGPVAFPGIFPDMTRYQAESDQQAVNQGNAPWKLDPRIVAINFATTLLKWPSDSSTTIVSGGGQNDANAVVSVTYPSKPSGTINLTMDRLEGNTNGGIWMITHATSDGTGSLSPTRINWPRSGRVRLRFEDEAMLLKL